MKKKVCYWTSCSDKVVASWTNSKGLKLAVCKEHLKLIQMIADDYEQTGKNSYRVIKSEAVPKDEVWFEKDGKIVTKIVNLGDDNETS